MAHAPTPEQVEAMMVEKMGELPQSLNSAKAIDPRFLVEQAMSSKFSMKDEKNPFDPKTSMLLALAVSLTKGSEECMTEQTKIYRDCNGELLQVGDRVKNVKGEIARIENFNSITRLAIIENGRIVKTVNIRDVDFTQLEKEK